MRPRRVVAALLAAAAFAVLATPGPAWAADDVEGNPYVGSNSAGYELKGVQEIGDTVTGPGLPAWLRECTWRQWTLLEKEGYYVQFVGGNPTRETLEARGLDPDEPWYVVFCGPGPEAIGVSPQVILTGILNTWAVGDPVPQSILDWLIAYGYALIEIPLQVGTSSPVGDVDAPMITQLPTWLWVDPAVWQVQSATTPPVFGVTATVTATPYRVEFTSSEGEYVDCGANEGPAYNYSLPGSAQSTTCSVTYKDASSVADQNLTSTVYWGVTYACSAFCGAGTLPDFEITNTRDVRVAELIGVGTSVGAEG